jgi:hypothetical protein
MTATQTTGTVSPLEHDTKTAELYAELEKAQRAQASVIDRAHRAVGDSQHYRGRRAVWDMRDIDATAKVRELARNHPDQDPYEGSINNRHPVLVVRALDKANAKVAKLREQIELMEEIYLASPWQRFFPCLNSDGHIHASLHGCSSVRFDTAMGWTPSLSGHTVEEAVAELGPMLCSICFPSAPVEWCRSKSELNAKPVCKGTGQYIQNATRQGSRYYANCPECGKYAQLTQYGYVRKHQPEEA